ncbi:MAG: sigma-70 family RNA polymerase sigma factor [Anaerolineae bacterium]|nr:sigma-70 family RNA polymerase sigma factor [Anaerolineae bacterium]
MHQVETTSDEDITLMLAAQHEPALFAKVYERYFQRIYAYCLRHVHNPHEAEDLASAVFIQAFRTLPQYRGGTVGAWLFRMAYGAIANYYRQSRPEVGLDDHAGDLRADLIEPLDHIVLTETHERLRALINALPEEDRQILSLKIDGELSSHEIGELLGKNPGAVRTQLHRIIKRIRQGYQQTEK